MAEYTIIDPAKYPLLEKKERKTTHQMVMDNKDTHLHVNKLYILLSSLFNKTSMSFPAILIHNKRSFLSACNLAKSTLSNTSKGQKTVRKELKLANFTSFETSIPA